jgi:sulfide dehydrogenase [flavocytochrome c] flavoprotein subunit
MSITRRRFMGLMGGAFFAVRKGWAAPAPAFQKARGKIVIVGGGYAGATCARYLRRYGPNLDITLVEPNRQYVTCPFSNTVIGGLRKMEDITWGYQGLAAEKIQVVHDRAEGIDPGKVRLAGGRTLTADAVVVAPGIALRWDAVEGYTPEVAKTIPHAWKAGEQTRILKRQVERMDDGGTILISVPGNPYRCPPGPYERASLIAHYLKQHKPRSKVIILDTKDAFPKQRLFMQAWEELYPGMIEWIPGSEGGGITAVDAKAGRLESGFGFSDHTGAVINLIPPQKAGAIAQSSGLTNDVGWCPVEPLSFESTVRRGIHVLGDSCIAGEMPKSAYSANSQAKVCARAIAARLAGEEPPTPSYINTCYSLLAPDYGISVGGVYRLEGDTISAVPDAGGVSPLEASEAFRQKEAKYARGWYDSIMADTLGPAALTGRHRPSVR